MIIFPAIDIINGKPVRLFKGDFSTAHQVAEDALETARVFEATGAEWIHMVDLDGSLKKERVNHDIFTTVAKETNLKVEVGGGIRTLDDIDYYYNHGISRVILGSVALKDPKLVEEAVKKYQNFIAVGIDAKKGFVATDGWTETSQTQYIDLAKKMEAIGIKTLVFTDISKDGTLSGPNVEALVKLNESVSCDIVASGGVSNINDIKVLRDNNLYGAICGKSIYSKSLDLNEALYICK